MPAWRIGKTDANELLAQPMQPMQPNATHATNAMQPMQPMQPVKPVQPMHIFEEASSILHVPINDEFPI